MIGLDTNALLRFLTRDDPGQADIAREFIQSASDRKEPLFVNHVVLCEVTWVLNTTYGYPREEIATALEGILLARQFEIEAKDLAIEALHAFNTSKTGFADCLIAARNRDAGCDSTITFDRTAASLDHFKLLK